MGCTDRHPLHNTATAVVESTVVEVELPVMIPGVSEVMLCSSRCQGADGKLFVHTMHNQVCTNMITVGEQMASRPCPSTSWLALRVYIHAAAEDQL